MPATKTKTRGFVFRDWQVCALLDDRYGKTKYAWAEYPWCWKFGIKTLMPPDAEA